MSTTAEDIKKQLNGGEFLIKESTSIAKKPKAKKTTAKAKVSAVNEGVAVDVEKKPVKKTVEEKTEITESTATAQKQATMVEMSNRFLD